MMRFFWTTALLFLLFPFVLPAQGIAFEQGLDWKGLLAKAKTENKLVFVDAFTTWCGPCKMMAKNVFPDKEVGEYFNAHFVNAKIDMEKGEGPMIAKQYSVRAYPTYLFVNGDGELVHTGLGYMPSPDFLNLARAAGDPNRQFQPMKKRWEKGERSAAFLYAFTDQVAQNDPFNIDLLKEVTEAYLSTQSDWLTPDNVSYLLQYAMFPDSKGFRYLLDHRAQVNAVAGQGAAESTIHQVIVNDIYTRFPSTETEMPIEEIKAYANTTYPVPFADQIISELELNFLAMQNDWKKYTEHAIAHIDRFGKDDYMSLNQIAWSFYENIDKKSALKKALNWALRSVELHSEYFNNDTVAALYYKLGNKNEARVYAEKAIALAKATQQDFSPTEALLQKINQ